MFRVNGISIKLEKKFQGGDYWVFSLVNQSLRRVHLSGLFDSVGFVSFIFFELFFFKLCNLYKTNKANNSCSQKCKFCMVKSNRLKSSSHLPVLSFLHLSVTHVSIPDGLLHIYICLFFYSPLNWL